MKTVTKRLRQLEVLAESHPEYFMHQFNKEYSRAYGHQEVVATQPVHTAEEGASEERKEEPDSGTPTRRLKQGGVGQVKGKGSQKARGRVPKD